MPDRAEIRVGEKAGGSEAGKWLAAVAASGSQLRPSLAAVPILDDLSGAAPWRRAQRDHSVRESSVEKHASRGRIQRLAASIRCMAQPDLLGSDPGLLLDDATGRIRYMPQVIAADRAQEWFAQLHEDIAWHAQRRMMYEREVDVPRLTSSFLLDDPALPPAVREAADVVMDLTNIRFNSAGLNLYRDGADSVAPHNDHLEELERGYPIALLSLGATRRMTIRAKQPPRRVLHVDLEPGSLLLMSWRTQHHYDHAIPKTREPVGPRISIAFRRRPESQAGGGFYRQRV